MKIQEWKKKKHMLSYRSTTFLLINKISSEIKPLIKREEGFVNRGISYMIYK